MAQRPLSNRLLSEAWLCLQRLLFAVLFCFAAPAQAQDASDFQLPAEDSPSAANRSQPNVQGPVDIDGPVPIGPRVIPQPSTSSTAGSASEPEGAGIADAPTSRTEQSPSAIAPNSQIRAAESGQTSNQQGSAPTQQPSTTQPRASAPTPSPSADQALPEVSATRFRLPSADETAAASDAGAAETTGRLPNIADPGPPPAPTDSTNSSQRWLVIAAIAAAVLALMAAIWTRFAKRRTVNAPLIQKPELDAVIELEDGVPDANSLAIEFEPTSFSRSILNGTATYRVTLRNKGSEALIGLSVEGDLTSASKGKTLAEQIAGQDSLLTQLHKTERLTPGQSVSFSGTVQSAMADLSFLRQGKTVVLIPLLRLRASAEGSAAIAKTYVIGDAVNGTIGKPQPFRMDEGPRSWSPLAFRAVEAPTESGAAQSG